MAEVRKEVRESEEVLPAGEGERGGAARRFLDAFRRTERPEEDPERSSGESRLSRPPVDQVWAKYPGEYQPPTPELTEGIGDRAAPFEDPRNWIGALNGNGPRDSFGVPVDGARAVNCADCSRSVERNWRGDRQVSAGLLSPWGENNERNEEWSGGTAREMSFAEVGQLLERGGHGSSAIVGFDRRPWEQGHFFNAVNFEGEVLAVDGQTGRVGGWPPAVDRMGFDENEAVLTDAIVWDAEGKQIDG